MYAERYVNQGRPTTTHNNLGHLSYQMYRDQEISFETQLVQWNDFDPDYPYTKIVIKGFILKL